MFVVVLIGGIKLHPYQHAIRFLLSGTYSRKTCKNPTKAPKLNLVQVEQCTPGVDRTKVKKPCVIRNKVSPKVLKKFSDSISDEKLVVQNVETEEIGHPLDGIGHLMMLENAPHCSLNDMLLNTSECYNTYTGFKSLNYSHFLPLEKDDSGINLNEFDRVDIFFGNLKKATVTAKFHANVLERSSTLQITGEKMWLLMKPQDFLSKLGVYYIGPYNALHSACAEDLENIELSAIHTQPGDMLLFPINWPHIIYTLPGPNLMLNFRNNIIRLAMSTSFLIGYGIRAALTGRIKKQTFDVSNCRPEEQKITSFLIGHPNPLSLYNEFSKYDLRCTNSLNWDVLNYINFSSHRVGKEAQKGSDARNALDRNIAHQISSFLGVSDADLGF